MGECPHGVEVADDKLCMECEVEAARPRPGTNAAQAERIRTLEEALNALYTAVHDPGVSWEDERINAAIETARRALYPDTERTD